MQPEILQKLLIRTRFTGNKIIYYLRYMTDSDNESSYNNLFNLLIHSISPGKWNWHLWHDCISSTNLKLVFFQSNSLFCGAIDGLLFYWVLLWLKCQLFTFNSYVFLTIIINIEKTVVAVLSYRYHVIQYKNVFQLLLLHATQWQNLLSYPTFINHSADDWDQGWTVWFVLIADELGPSFHNLNISPFCSGNLTRAVICLWMKKNVWDLLKWGKGGKVKACLVQSSGKTHFNTYYNSLAVLSSSMVFILLYLGCATVNCTSSSLKQKPHILRQWSKL